MTEKAGGALEPRNFDVVVVGGGIVGCAIARELSRYRLATALVERYAEVGFGTTKTNSGIIHAGHHSPADSLKGRLVVKGNAMFDRLANELGFGFRRCGELVVARDSKEREHLHGLLELGNAKGVPGLELWDAERLRREEPNLSTRLDSALYAPSAGVINPYECAFALAENARDNGVELFVDFEVVRIEESGRPSCAPCRKDRPGTVTSASGTGTGRTGPAAGGTRQRRLRLEAGDGRVVTGDFVINAAGVHSDEIAGMLGLRDFTIHPRKGEEYMLDRRLEGIVRRLIFPVPRGKSKGILIIPTYDGTLMVGPTAQEVDDRYDFDTSFQGAKEVFDFVSGICPSIHPRHTIAEFAGLRAASNTGDFIIGTTSVAGFINVAGIQSPGLTASPAIAEYVVEILGREGLPLVEKDDFQPRVEAPARFARLRPEKQRELAEADPSFGKVVCRCELVTEAEIVDAIRHGARTLDGVKFRTRAGMGRCQGGFCTARTMELLSRHLGVPIEDIGKRGPASWIVRPMKPTACRCAEVTDEEAAEPVPTGATKPLGGAPEHEASAPGRIRETGDAGGDTSASGVPSPDVTGVSTDPSGKEA